MNTDYALAHSRGIPLGQNIRIKANTINKPEKKMVKNFLPDFQKIIKHKYL